MAQRISAERRMQSYVTRVLGWMSGALGLTAITAYAVANVPVIADAILANPGVMMFIVLLQLGVVLFLSWRVHRLSVETAMLCFWAYAALTGVTFSMLFYVYTTLSLASTFLVAAGMYGIMAVYGSVTDINLTSIGAYARMALYGLIITMIVNWFLGSAPVYYAVGIIGVVVFSILTAYDMQRLQQLALRIEEVEEETNVTKITIMMALQLYLDFINLFLMLLRLMGTRRQ